MRASEMKEWYLIVRKKMNPLYRECWLRKLPVTQEQWDRTIGSISVSLGDLL